MSSGEPLPRHYTGNRGESAVSSQDEASPGGPDMSRMRCSGRASAPLPERPNTEASQERSQRTTLRLVCSSLSRSRKVRGRYLSTHGACGTAPAQCACIATGSEGQQVQPYGAQCCMRLKRSR